jgi:hypothetical protein
VLDRDHLQVFMINVNHLHRSLVKLNQHNNIVHQHTIIQVRFVQYTLNYPNNIFLGAYSTTYRSSYTHQGAQQPGYGQYGGNTGSQPFTKYV